MIIMGTTARQVSPSPTPTGGRNWSRLLLGSLWLSRGEQEAAERTGGPGLLEPSALPWNTGSQSLSGTFEKAWTRYKWISPLTDLQDIMDELWECMSVGLSRVCEDDQVEENSTAELELMAGVKKLDVRAHNTLIAQVQFLSMGQEREEADLSYSARLRGKSSLCNFMVKCTDCDHNISYAERVMAY
jgi:hypothetical protein